MLIAELLSGLKYNTYGVNLRGYVSGAASDSRRVGFGCVFVCLRGTRRDGHDYAEEAMRRGAVAVVSEYYIPRIPCIVVKDTRVADAVIWNNLYGRPASSLRLIGITGTNGKTSTAMFLSSVMNTAGIPTATLGTLGCVFKGDVIPMECAEVADVPASMTTPDPQFLYGALDTLRRRGAEAVVMEVSSHAIAQKKVYPLCFEVGVFTNLSPEHLDFHSSMDEYFKVKASVFSNCHKAVVCCDGEYGVRLAEMLGDRAERVESRSARELCMDSSGISYCYGSCNIRSSVTGLHTVQNTMLAARTAQLLGIDGDDIEAGILNMGSIPGRMERLKLPEHIKTEVFIDYAHTPDALKSAIETVRSFSPEKKLTVLFGCGGERDPAKRPEMGRIASLRADRIIVTSDNPRGEDRDGIIRDIVSGIKRYEGVRVIRDRAAALRYAVLTARGGEVILLCGKGHEDYETDGEGKHPFSEKEIIMQLLGG